MKFVLAPDSFKGTISSAEACDLMEREILKNLPKAKVVKVPVSDGGEGMVEAYLAGCGGNKVYKTVTGPKFDRVRAFYGILSDKKTAVVEMAAASGLGLAGAIKDPMRSTSYGTGELIADAVEKGCTKIILGMGGSATMDGGMGMACALGVKFFDERGCIVKPIPAELQNVREILFDRVDQKYTQVEFLLASDVRNTACGPNGASAVFGKQKGADEEQIRWIDSGLKDYISVMEQTCGKQLLKIPGTGAAGGLALPLLAFFDARIVPGIELILDNAAFDEKVKNADLVITGEGRLDAQSLEGKVPIGVARRAQQSGTPVIALVGDVGEEYERAYKEGILAIFSTNKAAIPFKEARKTAKEDLGFLVDSLFRFKKIF